MLWEDICSVWAGAELNFVSTIGWKWPGMHAQEKSVPQAAHPPVRFISNCFPAHTCYSVLAEEILCLHEFITSGISYNYGKLAYIHWMTAEVFFLKNQFRGSPASRHSQTVVTNHHCPLPRLGQKHRHLKGTEKYISLPFYWPLDKDVSKKRIQNRESQTEV